jgi:hypothetical protein
MDYKIAGGSYRTGMWYNTDVVPPRSPELLWEPLECKGAYCTQGFYDPVNEKMFEPSLTGISYSFTDDGHYEEAYYRAIANRTCPSIACRVRTANTKIQLLNLHALKV